MKKLKQQILQDYPSWPEFVKGQSPEQLVVNYDFVISLYKVYETTPITLDLLTELYPRTQSYAGYEYLEMWLKFLNEFLNINKGLQAQYIKQLSYILYAKYQHLRLSDLKLLFDYILESRYGTFYGSIDSQRIVSSFYEYNKERTDLFAKIETQQKEAEKKAEKDKPYSPPDLSKYPNIARLNQEGIGFIDEVARRRKP